MRIAVLTDLHAFDADHNATGAPPSWLRTDGNRRGGPLADPFKSLERLIDGPPQLTADFLLCAGDLTDKAQPAALTYVWRELSTLAGKLGAELIATAGNHDLDSRNSLGGVDPKELLHGLRPRFPVPHEAEFNKYWAQSFVVLERADCRFLVVNSASSHGYGGSNYKDVFEHGYISDRTIEAIVEELVGGGPRDRNILLCHHHPVRNNRLHATDESEMRNGEKLLSALDNAGVGDWLVVHGHRHVSDLAYAAGGSSSATVLSAGSFSVSLPASLGQAQNEFYLVDFGHSPGIRPLRGTIETWAWQMGAGWHKPGGLVGLPAMSGFGARVHPAQLAARIREVVSETPLTPVKWETIETRVPDVKFTLPPDIQRAIALLELDGVGISRSPQGLPSELQLRP